MVGLTLITGTLLAGPPMLPPEGSPGGVAPSPAPGEISGRVEGSANFELAAVRVELECSCLARPQRLRLDLRGEFQFFGLLPGRYRLRVHHGEQVVERELELGAGEHRELVVEVPAAPPPPAPSLAPAPAPIPPRAPAAADDGQSLRRVGLGVTVLGTVLGIGGAIVGFHNPCGRDGARGSNCETDVRNAVGLILGVSSLGTLAGGVAAMAVGQSLKVRQRAFDGGVALRLDPGGGGLLFVGRF